MIIMITLHFLCREYCQNVRTFILKKRRIDNFYFRILICNVKSLQFMKKQKHFYSVL
jgi:hypothetical protein